MSTAGSPRSGHDSAMKNYTDNRSPIPIYKGMDNKAFVPVDLEDESPVLVDSIKTRISPTQLEKPYNELGRVSLDGVTLDVTALSESDGLKRNGSLRSNGPTAPPRRRSRDLSLERNKNEQMKNTVNAACGTGDRYIISDGQEDSLPEDSFADARLPQELSSSLRGLKSSSGLRRRQSRGVQVWPTPPYRLKVLPRHQQHSWSGCKIGLGYIGRWAFCQLGLAILLFIWALAGATAFRYTEGPKEEEASTVLVSEQKQLIDNLASDLKQVSVEEPIWFTTIEKYMSLHEEMLAEARGAQGGPGAGAAAGEGGGRVWTFPGCVLFAVSLITTLGFGAPVPKTTQGRAVAVVFAAIGIPLHLLLVLNVGMVIAIKLQAYANRKQKDIQESLEDHSNDDIMPEDNKFMDFVKKSNAIFTNSHRRSGSEPIGRQAINNISSQANFLTNDLKENKYFHMKESPDRSVNGESQCKLDDKSTKDEACYKIVNLDINPNDKIYKTIGCEPHSIPAWLKWMPFIAIAFYYILGFLIFGVARSHPILDGLLFPLDFTVAGGVATTPGYVRVVYALYLEGFMVLAAVTVSILQVSATEGLTDLGLKYGLLTNSR